MRVHHPAGWARSKMLIDMILFLFAHIWDHSIHAPEMDVGCAGAKTLRLLPVVHAKHVRRKIRAVRRSGIHCFRSHLHHLEIQLKRVFRRCGQSRLEQLPRRYLPRGIQFLYIHSRARRTFFVISRKHPKANLAIHGDCVRDPPLKHVPSGVCIN